MGLRIASSTSLFICAALAAENGFTASSGFHVMSQQFREDAAT